MDTTLETIKPIQVGDTAPDFEATNQKGEVIKLSDLTKNGQLVLLVFYPADNTPGCTRQLCGVRDVYKEYTDLCVTVLGINKGSEKSHQSFIQSQGYQFDIVVDKDNLIRNKYGAIKKHFANFTTKRGVVLIDTEGKVIFTFWGQQDNQKIIEMLKNR